MTDDARQELIDTLLDQLSGGREELPEELRERLSDGMIDELIAGKRGEREILGQGGVLGEVTRRMVQRALEGELTLGLPVGDELTVCPLALSRRWISAARAALWIFR